MIAAARSEAWARLAAPVLWALVIITTPLRWLFERPLRRFFDDPDANGDGIVSSDELKLVIEQSREHGVVSELVHDRLIEIIDLSETPSSRVMTHRVDCLTVRQRDP